MIYLSITEYTYISYTFIEFEKLISMTIKQNLGIIMHKQFSYNSNKLISKPIRFEISFTSSKTFSPLIIGSPSH